MTAVSAARRPTPPPCLWAFPSDRAALVDAPQLLAKRAFNRDSRRGVDSETLPPAAATTRRAPGSATCGVGEALSRPVANRRIGVQTCTRRRLRMAGVAAQMHPAHAAGLVKTRAGTFQAFTVLTQAQRAAAQLSTDDSRFTDERKT